MMGGPMRGIGGLLGQGALTGGTGGNDVIGIGGRDGSLPEGPGKRGRPPRVKPPRRKPPRRKPPRRPRPPIGRPPRRRPPGRIRPRDNTRPPEINDPLLPREGGRPRPPRRRPPIFRGKRVPMRRRRRGR